MDIAGSEFWCECERLADLIAGHAGAKQLYNEVTALLGEISILPTLGTVSSYQLPLRLDPLRSEIVSAKPMGASISVAVESGRQLEAACHELLHLKVAVLGYAKVCSNTVPPELDPWRVTFLGDVNRIEHEVMLPHFLALGFSLDRFLASGGLNELSPTLGAFQGSRMPNDSEQ